MVRVAGLKGQVQAGVETLSPEGLTPRDQLVAVNERASRLMASQQSVWMHLRKELDAAGISVVDPAKLAGYEMPSERF